MKGAHSAVGKASDSRARGPRFDISFIKDIKSQFFVIVSPCKKVTGPNDENYNQRSG